MSPKKVMSEGLRVKTPMLKGHHEAHGTASSLVFLLMGMNDWGGSQPCTGFILSKECRLQAGGSCDRNTWRWEGREQHPNLMCAPGGEGNITPPQQTFLESQFSQAEGWWSSRERLSGFCH